MEFREKLWKSMKSRRNDEKSTCRRGRPTSTTRTAAVDCWPPRNAPPPPTTTTKRSTPRTPRRRRRRRRASRRRPGPDSSRSTASAGGVGTAPGCAAPAVANTFSCVRVCFKLVQYINQFISIDSSSWMSQNMSLGRVQPITRSDNINKLTKLRRLSNFKQ